MLLVIFGAGASFDSVDPDIVPAVKTSHSLLYRPPLAANLFEYRSNWENYIRLLPLSAPMIGVLRRYVQSGKPVEETLDELSKEAESGDEMRRKQVAAIRFYLQAVLWLCGSQYGEQASHVTNYSLLLDGIRQWSDKNRQAITFVTFNYDQLLEEAVRRCFDYPLRNVDAYFARRDLMLFKPHGSVNWVHPIGGDAGGLTDSWELKNYIVSRLPELSVSGGVFEMVGDIAGISSGGSRLWLPALAIPVARKHAFECPPSHVSAFSRRLSETDRMLVIGWRATEQTFLELLRDKLHSPLPLQIVAGPRQRDDLPLPALLPRDNLRESGIEGKPELLFDGGLTDFVRAGAVAELLSA